MLNTSMLEEMYEETMTTWIQAHRDAYMFAPLVCDLCGGEEDGVLHNIPGVGRELLVCGLCYLKGIYYPGVES